VGCNVTQNPQEGSATVPGDVLVTLTGARTTRDTADTSFTVTIRPANGRECEVARRRRSAPGAGTNGARGRAAHQLRTPGTDDGANLAFLAKWDECDRRERDWLFLNDACLGIAVATARSRARSIRASPIRGGRREGRLHRSTDRHTQPLADRSCSAIWLLKTALEAIAQAGGAATVDGRSSRPQGGGGRVIRGRFAQLPSAPAPRQRPPPR